MYLLGNGKLITRDTDTPYFACGGVVIDGTKILALGDFGRMREKYPAAEFIDAKGGVIMPGLINAHTHIYSALARGLSINGYNPTNFFEVLDGMWWNIDRHLTLDGTRASAQATIIDCIKQGVTTIFDHHASFKAIPGSLFTIAHAAKELGMRACLCYEVSDRDGEQKSLEGIRENAEFISYCEKDDTGMIRAMFGGHALFTISDKTFERMAEANSGRTGFHIHVSEG
ncbi:MAG: amidohydrolase family protein, partial [Oscillospiraceae bacterium]